MKSDRLKGFHSRVPFEMRKVDGIWYRRRIGPDTTWERLTWVPTITVKHSRRGDRAEPTSDWSWKPCAPPK